MTPIRAVLLDAAGTLMHFGDPAAAMTRRLRDEGFGNPPDAVAAALADEIAFYRGRMAAARTPEALEDLRDECARVFRSALPQPPPVDVARRTLLGVLVPQLFPEVAEVLDALRARGLRLAVVSNWDITLRGRLADLGVADRFDAVFASAEVGVSKPDPVIFHMACDALGVEPADALHCGDDEANDLGGARGAGCRAVLVHRGAGAPPGAIRDLRPLVELAL